MLPILPPIAAAVSAGSHGGGGPRHVGLHTHRGIPVAMATTAKRLVVLGAGTAGTMVVNKLRRALSEDDWVITVVDRDDVHDYQPGYLFLPFGLTAPEQVRRHTRPLIAKGVNLLLAEVDRVAADERVVHLVDGRELPYDQLVIATGTTPRPDQTPGTLGSQWHHEVGEFYTYEGALALRDRLAGFTGGRLVVHITELPIKCPVAPLEFTFLAEAWLRKRGLRDRVELVFVTPLDGAFTQPVASEHLGAMLAERKIHVEPDFMVERIDDERKMLVSYDEREVPFDLLV